jgi:RNA polymerase sigma-70 factor (ECF subfamily)
MRLQLIKSTAHVHVRADDAEPFDELYERYAAQVRRWARRLAGPDADLEDLVHDTFVVAFRRRFAFRGQSTVKTWLFRITHHVVRGSIRRRFLRRFMFRKHEAALAESLPGPTTPQEEMERRERHRSLYQALDNLSDCYRTTIILYEIDGLSGEEVAELTEVSLGTVWVRLHRAREKLTQLLLKEKQP